ncbi:hypothetical protein HFTV1-gp61 [Haloferax tailed virus 1]|uniref:Uncharacterized protein n=1 Tax=Haloferax tailed virus 1 TaxID=2507575 RepID=A0A410N6Z3_HFTV1|nr:hypothetical protein M1M17_gp61 [Haloferax tailed virus 1]QAS68894.1 hypothetical protein HFTV1-gp61 [Haloferax tailed virus 1]
MHPECPECETDVFVDALSYEKDKYRCQFCEENFRVTRI